MRIHLVFILHLTVFDELLNRNSIDFMTFERKFGFFDDNSFGIFPFKMISSWSIYHQTICHHAYSSIVKQYKNV